MSFLLTVFVSCPLGSDPSDPFDGRVAFHEDRRGGTPLGFQKASLYAFPENYQLALAGSQSGCPTPLSEFTLRPRPPF